MTISNFGGHLQLFSEKKIKEKHAVYSIFVNRNGLMEKIDTFSWQNEDPSNSVNFATLWQITDFCFIKLIPHLPEIG